MSRLDAGVPLFLPVRVHIEALRPVSGGVASVGIPWKADGIVTLRVHAKTHGAEVTLGHPAPLGAARRPGVDSRPGSCGTVLNPDVDRAQMEGGIGFGLSSALYGAIKFMDGAVDQSNINDYRLMPIDDAPANALCAATTKRVRQLPVGAASPA